MTEQARLFGLCLFGSVLLHAAVLAMRVERPQRLARPDTRAIVWRLTTESERSSAVTRTALPAVREPVTAPDRPDRTVVRAEQPPMVEDAPNSEIERAQRTPAPSRDEAARRVEAANRRERTIVRSAPAKQVVAQPAEKAEARIDAAPAPRAEPSPSGAAAAPSAAPAASAPSVASLPSAPAPPAAENARGDETKIRASYEQVLSAWIERHKFYPLLALRRREEGTVWLRISLDRDGRVVESALREPSRVASLDRAALEIVRRADPFPAPPAELAGEGFAFVVPIRFSLADR